MLFTFLPVKKIGKVDEECPYHNSEIKYALFITLLVKKIIK